MSPTFALPRPVVDAVRALQVLLVALTPFLPVSTLVQAFSAAVAALVPLLVIRSAVTPVADVKTS